MLILEHWPGIILAVLLVIASITDVMCGKIHNVITYPAIIAGLLGHTLCGGLSGDGEWLGLTGALAGLAMGGGPMFIGYLAGGINGGDVKITAAIGALTGWAFTLDTLFYGLIVAAVMAFAVMIRKRIVIRTLKRVGRFLYLAMTPTKPADPALTDSPKIPLGLAMCVGAIIVVAIDLFKGSGLPDFIW